MKNITEVMTSCVSGSITRVFADVSNDENYIPEENIKLFGTTIVFKYKRENSDNIWDVVEVVYNNKKYANDIYHQILHCIKPGMQLKKIEVRNAASYGQIFGTVFQICIQELWSGLEYYCPRNINTIQQSSID